MTPHDVQQGDGTRAGGRPCGTRPRQAGVYAALGRGSCFAVNDATYGAVIHALVRTMSKPVEPHPIVLAVTGLIGVVSLFGISSATIFPVWALRVLQGDATTNGLLHSDRGIDAFCGAPLIASVGRFICHGKLLTACTFAFPVMVLICAAVRVVPASHRSSS